MFNWRAAPLSTKWDIGMFRLMLFLMVTPNQGTWMYIFYINLIFKDSLTSYVIRYQSIPMPIWPNMCNRIGWSQQNVYISWLYECLYSAKWSGSNFYLPQYWIALENVPLFKIYWFMQMLVFIDGRKILEIAWDASSRIVYYMTYPVGQLHTEEM